MLKTLLELLETVENQPFSKTAPSPNIHFPQKNFYFMSPSVNFFRPQRTDIFLFRAIQW